MAAEAAEEAADTAAEEETTSEEDTKTFSTFLFSFPFLFVHLNRLFDAFQLNKSS